MSVIVPKLAKAQFYDDPVNNCFQNPTSMAQQSSLSSWNFAYPNMIQSCLLFYCFMLVKCRGSSKLKIQGSLLDMELDRSVALVEESFHDEWAASIRLDELDVYAAFTAETTPEFHYALELLGALPGKHLLDVGCGPGESSIFLANQGADVTAIDLSSGMIRVARDLASRFEISSDHLRFIQAPIESLKFPDETFDLVFGSNVLHHCNIEMASKEIYRVLRPGGRAVFVDPLGYNPIIKLYRHMAFKVRTPTEHPLVYNDIKLMERHFSSVTHKEFQLTTQAIFIWFFLIERIHPSEERYWRKFVLESHRYAKAFNRLYAIDNYLLSKLPFFRRQCWNIVTSCDK